MTESTKHWRYQVPSEKLSGWAIVYLDDAGALSVVSDYGEFGHMWGRAGRGSSSVDFRDEILRFETGYLLDKLSYGTGSVFDEEATRAAIKEAIAQSAHIDREAEAELLETSDLETELGFADWCKETTLAEPWVLHCSRRDNRDRELFIERTWPRVRMLIAAEVEAERRRPA